MKRFKISVTLLIIVILFLGLGGISLLTYNETRQLLTVNLEHSVSSLTLSTAAEVSQWLDTRRSEIELMANTPLIKSGNIDGIKAYMNEELQRNSVFEQFFVTDNLGHYYLNSGQTGSVADRDYFKKVMATGQTMISDPLISRGSGNQIIVVAAPIKKDGRVVGLLGGNVNIKEVNQKVTAEKIADNGYAFMVREDGLVISHPNKDLIMKYNALEEQTAPPEVKAATVKMAKGETGFAKFRFPGEDKYMAYAPVRGANWSLGIAIPSSYITNQLYYLPVFFIVVTVFFGVIMVFLLSRWLVLPLTRLAKITTEVTDKLEEVEEHNWIESPVSEVNSLTANFQNMVAALKTNFQQLKVANTKLEAEIEERIAIQDDLKRSFEELAVTEEKLRKNYHYDSLTGLFNRTYFEENLRLMGSETLEQVGIVVCDVDGLKFVNDTLGHSMGDQLLKLAANTIKRCFRDEDAVSRIGGDEFAVILPNSKFSVVEQSCRRIKNAVADYNATNSDLPLSLSVGFAVGSTSDRTISDIFKEADNNMYREKLHRSQSTRSALVQALMKALEERDFITEGHADRLQNLVWAVGKSIGIPDRNLVDLRLLAQFHDIGKVGVPDRILLKPAALSPEEYAEMQRHCEIGHRIAQSAPDLIPIADWILKHHEWWNGQGYPLSISGEDIPLECRILAIADAYDAMTSNRPYRKAMPHEEAVEELKRKAGSQFDPQLVPVFVSIFNDNGPMRSWLPDT